MTQRCDVLILGGGAIGLATAVELALAGTAVTVLTRSTSEAALYAAAGMLAPQAEGITQGAMLKLCLQSRDLYPSWIHGLEQLTGESGGYWPCGILCPTFNDPSQLWEDLEEKSESAPTQPRQWYDQSAVRALQPGISPEVQGGWYFPKDAQVDNRRLGHLLTTAAEQLGVQVKTGVTVTQLEVQRDRVLSVQTSQGLWRADQYLLATGAWSHQILSLPVYPRKGQMMSVLPGETASTLALEQVLFGPQVYLVPRRSGEIVIGATSEAVGFAPHNTLEGLQQLIQGATRMLPSLATYRPQAQWWGYRPLTPDELPILGPSPYGNLAIATGHYRNGVLLAPVTAKLMTEWMLHRRLDPMLSDFRWDRWGQVCGSSAKIDRQDCHSRVIARD
ncbi:glycine oxidase ThiO [Lyngbya confervoides]|uniref:glycine oxidase n=1 Tax=Lyngbya confervoides BDU141951 TaxID=1574623 RepID=A0ABD4T3Q7_9CYAN|nr:glycine oxidase ThiO [Lyngbya confervoides]MCM1983451.1 glycine oxidase ThiO [Lyngbya confervoides BDU141951]